MGKVDETVLPQSANSTGTLAAGSNLIRMRNITVVAPA